MSSSKKNLSRIWRKWLSTRNAAINGRKRKRLKKSDRANLKNRRIMNSSSRNS
jgi:hypothetical protein